MTRHGERRSQPLAARPAADELAQESLPRNAQTNRPAQSLESLQVGEQFEVVCQRFAEADPRVNDEAAMIHSDRRRRLQPLFDVSTETGTPLCRTRAATTGTTRASSSANGTG